MSLATIRTRVDQISKVPTAIVDQTASGDRDNCIADALARYNRDRPRRLVLVVAAVGGSTWEYSLTASIAAWNPSQYGIDYVVYPGGYQTEQRLDENDYDVHRLAAGTYWLRFRRNAPASGYDMWIHYTAPHTLDGTTDTVTADYPNDVGPFTHLCAAFVLREASNNYSKMSASSIGADNVDYKGLSDYSMRRAKDEEEIYTQAVAADRGAQSSFLDWDTTAQDANDMLFWPGRQS